MKHVSQYERLDRDSQKRRVLVDGVSRRQILRETEMHRQTLKKILEHSEPPGYRQQQPRPRKKLGAFLERIKQILKDDQAMPRKQRHTAKRILERLREDGFTGGYTVVKDAVRELTQKTQEVFVPLLHRPGEAQVDFGHALANVNGQLRKVAFFVMALPYSDATFVMAFARECTETFWEGHVRAFEFSKGVPTRITYDNTKVAVSKILGKERRLTHGFLQLKSHYLFDHHFRQHHGDGGLRVVNVPRAASGNQLHQLGAVVVVADIERDGQAVNPWTAADDREAQHPANVPKASGFVLSRHAFRHGDIFIKHRVGQKHRKLDSGFLRGLGDFDLHAVGDGLRSRVGVNDGAKVRAGLVLVVLVRIHNFLAVKDGNFRLR